MKKYLLIYLSLILAVSFTACNEDVLDVTNPNQITDGSFWKTSDDLSSALIGCYSQFTRVGNWGRWIYFRYDLTSDEGYSTSPWTELADWTKFKYSNYDFIQGGLIHYKNHYMQINQANQIIEYSKKIEPKDANDAEKIAVIVGQAKFIRAFDYFNLMMMFGRCEDVFGISKAGDKPQMIDTDTIRARVIKDLNDAIAVLPASYSGNDVGRVTKGAAYALLGKVYMQNHEWQKAKDAFYWLVEGAGKGLYGLMDNYADNFTHYKENNKESVFEIQFSDVNPTEMDRNNGSDIQDDVPVMMIGNTRSQFFAGPGIGWADGKVRGWLVDSFKREPTVNNLINGTTIDDRLRQSILYPQIFVDFPNDTSKVWLGLPTIKSSDKINGGWPKAWGTGKDDCYFRKYEDDYFKTKADYVSPINYRIIRYADVLLCYAECLAQLGDLTNAVKYVDVVRTRPSTNLPPLAQSAVPYIAASASNVGLFLKELQTSRALELCLESVRWFDLKRWGVLEDQNLVDQIAIRDPDFSLFRAGINHVMPLPSREVNNNPNLQQYSFY